MSRLLAPLIVTVLTFMCSYLSLADEPATQSVVIDASDKTAIQENMNREVVIRAEISMAAWSRSGKVMNIEFKDTQDSKLLAVLFERNRKAFDEAYGGDVAKTLTGAKVRLEGTLRPYGGREESRKDWPQIILDRITQVTIVEPAPSTQPTN